MRVRRCRTGIHAVEVIVVLVIVGIGVLVLFTALPRQREVSRRAACQQNLGRIGVAVVLYDQDTRALPGVPELPASAADGPSGPIPAMLRVLGQPDFSTMAIGPDTPRVPKARPRPSGDAWRIAGLICPSDRSAVSQARMPGISYRATTGAITSGGDGAFAPGRTMSLVQVADADGTGFTAAFSERLVGDGAPGPGLTHYAVVPGRVHGGACDGIDPASWRGDAGSSWATANWANTLYNHALTPGDSPSCVASDGRTARMGASSAHAEGVHVLLFDLSVKSYASTVDPKVWRDLATVSAGASAGSEIPSP